jgi:hypothetical protein
MKALLVGAALGLGLLLSAGAYAEAPAGATAVCKDGTYYSGTTHKGACRGHKGVKEWLNADAAAAAPASSDAAAKAQPQAESTQSSQSKKASKTAQPAPATAATAAATAPANATALCKDGTYFTGTTHKGACRGHKGVKEWMDGAAANTATAAAAAPAAAASATAAPAAAAKPASPVAPPAYTKSKRKPPTPAAQIEQKPGGGPGLVWVNAESKVYHCSNDPWYGKTKQGSYMSESAAKAAGNHGARGKDCDSK